MANLNVEGQSETPPALPKYVSSSLYIADLDLSTIDTEDILFELFSEFGSVLSVKVCYTDSKTKTGKPLLGHGYVNFRTVKEAALAWEKMNYKDLNGTPMRLIFSNLDATARYNPRANLIVKNLAASIDSEALYHTFAAMGVVLSCKVERDESGKSLEYGFIQFQDEEDAEQAMKLVNGMLLEGKQVYVGPFIPRKGKERIDMMRTSGHYDVSPQLAVEPIEKPAESSELIDSTDDETVCTSSTPAPTNVNVLQAVLESSTAGAARVRSIRPRRFSIARRKARAQQILEPAIAAIVAQRMKDDPLYDPSYVPSSEPWPLQPWSVHTLKTMYASARLPEERLAMLGGTLVPLVENLTFEFCKEVTDELIKADIEDVLLLMESPPALKYRVDEIKRQLKKKLADQAAFVTALSPLASKTVTKVVSKSSDQIPAATGSYGTGFFDVLNGVQLLLRKFNVQHEG